MKKLVAYLLPILLALSLTQTVAASGTTVLTATVPPAEYTLSIPLGSDIAFGTESAYLGALSVSEATGFGPGKNLKITVSHTAFAAEEASTTVPYEILAVYQYREQDGTLEQALSDNAVVFEGNQEHGLTAPCITAGESGQTLDFIGLQLKASSGDWAKAQAGSYRSAITYIAEIVTAED